MLAFFSPSTQATRNGVKVGVVEVMDIGAHGFDQGMPRYGLATLTEQAPQETLFRGGQAETMADAVGNAPSHLPPGPIGGLVVAKDAVPAGGAR